MESIQPTDWSQLTVLVTGAAGFIGSRLVQQLLDMGTYVRGLDLRAMPSRFEPWHGAQLTWLQADLLDEPVLSHATAGVTHVFHLAAIASVPKSVAAPRICYSVNTMGTFLLAQAALEHNVRRLIFSSSSAVYGGSGDTFEAVSTRPTSPYGASKAAAEQILSAHYHSFGLESVCLRYFNVYGDGQSQDSGAVIPNFLSKLREGASPPIYGSGLQTRDFIHVSDVVRANLAAATSITARADAFNIGTGHETSLLELFSMLRSELNVDIEPLMHSARPGELMRSVANTKRAIEELGFHASLSLRDGLSTLTLPLLQE